MIGAFSTERHYRWLLPAVLVALGWLAWTRRFIQDDAFISFRYARNLVEGAGLVWNPGERVEGYTNFLWTLGMGVPFLLGVDPIAFCYALGPVFCVLTLYVTSRIVRLLVPSTDAALLAVVLLGTNPSFAGYATGGLETPLLTCLQTALVWLLLECERRDSAGVARYAGLSVLGALCVMTRLDAAPVVGLALVFAEIWRRPASRAESARSLAALIAPMLVLVGGWLAWKVGYYGELIPNTFFAKTGASGNWQRGLGYLWTYVSSYLLLPVLALIAAATPRLIKRAPGPWIALASMLLVHAVYVASIGGDFMEFRMMVPGLPLLVALTVWSLFTYTATTLLRAAGALVVLLGSAYHAYAFTYTRGIETLAGLESHLYDPVQDWVGLGKALGQAFPDAKDVSIALTPAGAIPFYSQLPSVDMLGLNDPWVARHGIRMTSQPGHVRVAPLSYLVARRVQLVLVHPWVNRPSPPMRTSYALGEFKRFILLFDVTAASLPPGASIVEIPLEDTRVLVALYLTPHPRVDALISLGRWRRFAIDR